MILSMKIQLTMGGPFRLLLLLAPSFRPLQMAVSTHSGSFL